MDVVVTVAQYVWLSWLAEGDLPGESSTGEWGLYYGSGAVRRKPSPPKNLHPGDRVYVVAWGLLRGYAPLLRVETQDNRYVLVRGGGAATACSLSAPGGLAGELAKMPSFQGVRYRWWEREDEVIFPDWQTRGLPARLVADVERLAKLREDPARRRQLRERALSGAPPLFQGMP